MMKKMAVLVALPALLLALTSPACKAQSASQTNVPALNGGQEAQILEIPEEHFMAQHHVTRAVELIRPGSLIVSLGSNPATGFEWGEAQVSNRSVVVEQSHVFVPPQTEGAILGAPSKDVWVFDSQQPGKATILMSYSRPFEGGEKNFWTVTLTVTVR